jgi:curved DNA-binding protein CbpA
MTKKYYQILEISETATSEDIKKAYRKLAQQWHPDKWSTKSLAEREKANEKMQEINKAYEVLSDEDKRKRYDLGETNFNSGYGGYNYEEEIEELNRKKEAIDDELEQEKEKSKILAREAAILWIETEMSIREFSSKHLKNIDSKLWSPYSCWQEKMLKVMIKSDVRGKAGIDTTELDNFREQMLAAIKKAKELYEMGVNNPELENARVNSIETIEKVMKKKGLKTEDLNPNYSNYKEQINNLDKVWKIRALRDKITKSIRSQKANGDENRDINIDELGEVIEETNDNKFGEGEKVGNQQPIQKNSKPREKNKMKPAQSNGDFLYFTEDEYDDWTKDELVAKIKQLKSENRWEELNKKIKGLEAENEQLKKEVEELKKEQDVSPEFQVYVSSKEAELQNKQSKLELIKDALNSIQEPKAGTIPTDNNNFPTILIIGGVIFFSILSFVFLLNRTRKGRLKK